MGIGEKIAELRRERNLTQEALGEEIGVSAQTVSKWENGVNMPDVLLLPVIADYFGISIDELYGRKSEKRLCGMEDAPEFLYDSLFRDYCDIWRLGMGSDEAARWMDGIREGVESGMSSYMGSYKLGGTLISRDYAFIFKGIERGVIEDERIGELFSGISKTSVRKIIVAVHETEHNEFFTTGSLAKKVGLSVGDVKEGLDFLVDFRILVKDDVPLDEGGMLSVYTKGVGSGEAVLYFMMIALAKTAADDPYYFGYRGTEKLIK